MGQTQICQDKNARGTTNMKEIMEKSTESCMITSVNNSIGTDNNSHEKVLRNKVQQYSLLRNQKQNLSPQLNFLKEIHGKRKQIPSWPLNV